MEIACPKCDAVLSEVTVTIPHTMGVHCGMCGNDFGVSMTSSETEPAGSVSETTDPAVSGSHIGS